jgi:fructokinase
MDESEFPGPSCYCGKRGCIEAFLSGPSLSADHRQQTGQALSAEVIVERAQADDASAVATLARYEHRAARALAAVINVVDPDVIVLGGGLSNVGRLYTNIPRLWGQFVFACDSQAPTVSPSVPGAGLVVRTPLRRARHGDSSGVRGAAWLGAVELDTGIP